MNGWLMVMGLAVASSLAALWLTGRARTYALSKQMIDVANQRGSHSAPTPRGGGVAIVAATVAAVAVAYALGLADPFMAAALIGGGLPVASIGWLDDHGHVRASARITAHSAGAAVVVWALGPLPLPTILPFWGPNWPIADVAVTLLFLVWMINLFNFMDGIDGIAGGETATVCLCGAVLAWIVGAAAPAIIAAPLILAAAAIGFLWWNWPPAQIFMGDVSSGFLGLALGALTLGAGRVAPELAAAWIVLLGAFIADATVTVVHRLVRGEKVYEAHRNHAYQRLTRKLGRHLPVTLGTLAITLCFCFPVAWLMVAGFLKPFSGVLIAFIPLVAAALAMGAGSGED
jgi:Fuc2NAc and GlcNAc transferase